MPKNRSVLNSPRLNQLKKKRRKALRVRLLLLLIGVIVIIGGMTYVSRLPNFNIKDVTVTGNKILDAGEIKATVNKHLEGHYVWLFPRTNFLLYPKQAIEKDLTEKFGRAQNISANIRGTQALDVVLGERVASYMWCGEEPKKEIEECYFMDESGYVFDKAPYFSGNVYFKFFGKTTGDGESPQGTYYMNGKFTQFLSLRDIFKTMGIKVSSLLVKDDGDAEFYLAPSIAAPDAPRIMFKATDDFNKIAENLQAALTVEPLKTDFKKNYAGLSYIDLRFGNKVYYKFK